MNKRGYAKLVTVAISVAVLAGLFTLFDTDEILEIAASVSPSGVALVVVLLLLNQLLSTVRMKLFLRTDDSLATWLRLNHVNVQSLVAGLLFFNFIGQGLSRSRSYQREGLEADAFMVTGIERIISMTSLFALAFFSALLSFGGISLSGDYVAEILAVVITLTIAVSGAAIGLVYFARFRPVQNIFTGQQLRLLAGCAAVSTGMHLLMASAYLVVVQQLVPEAGLFAISGVVFIVMLAASLPISFAGWGIRELSAGFAFAQIGQSAEAGISVSIVLGVLASLTLVAHWLISQGLVTRLRKPVSLSRVGRELDGLSVQMTALLSLGIGMIIVFVMRVPTASGEISVNLADPLAIVAGLSFAYFLLTVKDRPPVVHVPGLPWALALGAAAILLAGLHGFVRFGVTDWALYNRMVGLGVLAAYFLAGASLVHFHGRAGFNAVGVCFFSAVFSVLLFEYAVRGFDVQPFSSYFETLSFTGFMLNSNKHAFVLLTALAAAGLLGHARAPRLASVLCGALTFGILLSYSRAGLATALIVIVLLRCFKCVSLR
ncbi:MAG: flippase-like domain-containing protein [Gammaproteobacteria bacterium]|nr:flippase-like domain-containing protein [Gammaproteobacteria bacterium]